jgi:hypothetical protein
VGPRSDTCLLHRRIGKHGRRGHDRSIVSSRFLTLTILVLITYPFMCRYSFLQPEIMPNSKHMGSRRIAPRPQANELYTSATTTAKSQAQHHLPSIELKRAQVRAACLSCQRRKSKVRKLQTFTQTFPRYRELLIKLG